MYQNVKDKLQLIERIFKPRIDRHEILKNKNLSLDDILGKTQMSSNELAWTLRDSATTGKKKKVLYQGAESFVGLWSSDIRIMIQMLVDILREGQSQLKDGNFVIGNQIQDKVYRAAGGEFLAYTATVPNPAFLERPQSIKSNISFGTHLKDIVEAFVNISRFELVEGKIVANQERRNPKQAFRLEIVDKFELEPSVQDFYDGLVRWHIFLQDWRGKSVRGMITPRLFLNRVLIPHSQLTFSSHDNLQLSNQELMRLLKEPKAFVSYWKKKRKKESRDANQESIKFK